MARISYRRSVRSRRTSVRRSRPRITYRKVVRRTRRAAPSYIVVTGARPRRVTR